MIRHISVYLVGFLLITSLFSCDFWAPDETQVDPVTIVTTNSASRSMGVSRSVDGPVTDPVSLYLGIKAAQSGCLVGSHSSTSSQTIEFKLTAIARDGQTVVGYTNGPTDEFGRGEEFVLPDPSVDSTLPDGTRLWGQHWLGMFISRFSSKQSTTMLAYPNAEDADAPEVIDEVVLRIALYGETMFDAHHNEVTDAFLMTEPHFVVESEDGPIAYSGRSGTLLVNGQSGVLDSLEYVFFVPASIVGSGHSALVHGSQTVATPILDKSLYSFPTDFTMDPDWILDDVGNAGLFAAIDRIAGVDNPSNRRSTPKWVEVAEYFQRFFTKFYRAQSTMFNIDNGLGYGGLGNGGNSAFQIIALDDANGGLVLTDGAVLTVAYEPTNASFNVNGGTLEVVADPVLEFSAGVTYPSE